MHLLADHSDDPCTVGHSHHDKQQVTDPSLEPQTRRGMQSLIDLLKRNLATASNRQALIRPQVLPVDHGVTVSHCHTR